MIAKEDLNKVRMANGYFFQADGYIASDNTEGLHKAGDIAAVDNNDSSIDIINPFRKAEVINGVDNYGGKYSILFEMRFGKKTGRAIFITHLDDYHVESNSIVSKGAKIGIMGTTGWCDPATFRHAHVSLRRYKINNNGTVNWQSRKRVRFFNPFNFIFGGFKIWKRR